MKYFVIGLALLFLGIFLGSCSIHVPPEARKKLDALQQEALFVYKKINSGELTVAEAQEHLAKIYAQTIEVLKTIPRPLNISDILNYLLYILFGSGGGLMGYFFHTRRVLKKTGVLPPKGTPA